MNLRSLFPLLALTSALSVATATETGVRAGWSAWDQGRPATKAFEVPPARNNGEVWSLLPGDEGTLWLGADDLYRFNGQTTTRLNLPFGSHAIRGLTRDRDGVVWLGAIDEIGRVVTSPTGAIHYQSARPELEAAGLSRLGNVWHAQNTPEGPVFVCDQHVLRWNGHRFDVWSLPSRSQLSFSADGDRLWLFQPQVGLLRMDASGPQVIYPVSDLPSSHGNWAITVQSPTEAHGQTTLLIGMDSGVFLRDGTTWRKLPRLSELLQGQIPWRIAPLDAETFVVGSYLDGLVIASVRDEILAKIDRGAGLPQERICSLWYDGEMYVWAGYPGGVLRIEARGGVSLFDHRIGFNESPVTKVLQQGESTVIVSPRQVARLLPGLPGRPADLDVVPDLIPAFSDATVAGNSLWVSGFNGLLWRLGAKVESFESKASGLILNVLEPSRPDQPVLFVQETFVNALLPAETLSESVQSTVLDLGTYPIQWVRDPRGDLWVSTPTRGILRLRLDATADGLPPQILGHYTHSGDLPLASGRPLVTTLGGEVFTLNEGGVFRFDASRDAFLPASELPNFVAFACAPTTDPNVAYWIVRRPEYDPTHAEVNILVRVHWDPETKHVHWSGIDSTSLTSAGRITGLSFTDAHGGVLWVAGTQALVRLAVPLLREMPPPPAVKLTRVIAGERDVSAEAGTALAIEPGTPSLTFEFGGLSRIDRESSWLQTRLLGNSPHWSVPQSPARIELTGLAPGNYVLEARALDLFGQASPSLRQSFVVVAPWYRRWPAITAYVVLSLVLVVAGVRWRLRQLAAKNEILNRLVDERTRELAQANVAKNEFLESISHEIRNPLNGISNLVDLLRDVPLAPEARELSRSLSRSTEHLKKVFSSVLSYTTLEYGHTALAVAPFSLVEILRDVVALFRPEARELGVEITLQIPPDFADGFKGDAEKIHSVISNYVANALKYAPHSPVAVTVRVLAATPLRSDIWLGVSDQGPGLAPLEQERLFKKFARGDQARASHVPGTGLGLATCRALAELMEGHTGVESTPGQGATFWLQLPLLRSALSEVPPASESEREANDPRLPCALIVDDQEYNRTVLKGVARRLGYRPFEASHAGEVWPLLERERFAVVFLDWELPGLNGGEIAVALRAHDSTRHATVIATTAHASEDVQRLCREAKMNGFALKPFDTEQIRRLITEARGPSASNEVAEAASGNAQTTMPGEISWRAFEDFSAGDPSRSHQAVELYLRVLEDEMNALVGAAQAAQRENIARIAHRIRSHAGLVNASQLNHAARDLYQLAKQGAMEDIHAAIQPVLQAARALHHDVLARAKRRA